MIVNVILDKVERQAEPGSRGFPPINREILRIGRIKIFSSFKLSLDRDHKEDDAGSGPARGYRTMDGWDTNTKVRLDKDVVYFELRFKF